MRSLKIQEIQALRLAVFHNAETLYREAELLFRNGMYSRAYLLAHFCVEELGKLPILVGVVGDLNKGELVDWKQVQKSFCSHTEKIGMQNGHFYAFGRDPNLPAGTELEWLLTANSNINETYRKKDVSTYVDVVDGKILSPLNEITKVDAETILGYASACVLFHERSESLTNPLIYTKESNEAPGSSEGST